MCVINYREGPRDVKGEEGGHVVFTSFLDSLYYTYKKLKDRAYTLLGSSSYLA